MRKLSAFFNILLAGSLCFAQAQINCGQYCKDIDPAAQQLDKFFDYGHKFIEAELKNRKVPPAPPAKGLNAGNYDFFSLSLYSGGKEKAFIALDDKKNFPSDLTRALSLAVKTAREKSPDDNFDDRALVYNFNFSLGQITSGNITAKSANKEAAFVSWAKDFIEWGATSVRLELGGKKSFIPSQAIFARKYNVRTVFADMCVAGGMDTGCYLNPNAVISLYYTSSYSAKTEMPAARFLRGMAIPADITRAELARRIFLVEHWFQNNIGKYSYFTEYEYDPVADKYSSNNNFVRQTASIWALALVRNFTFSFNAQTLSSKIKRLITKYRMSWLLKHRLKYLISRIKTVNGQDFVEINKQRPIAFSAFALLALCETKDYPKFDKYIPKLADGLIKNQRPDGSFSTYFLKNSVSGQDYYTGEAMLALIKCYERTKDKKYLRSVQRAFYFYRNYWRQNKNTAFVPWHSQVYHILYTHARKKEFAEFVFEMADWTLKNQITRSIYPDRVGAIIKGRYPGMSTFSQMEGLLDAYKTAVLAGDAKRAEIYNLAAIRGIKFIMRQQYLPESDFYLPNPETAVGGFRNTLTDYRVRIDGPQHAMAVLLKAYELL